MYFEYESKLDKNKVEASQEKFRKLSNEEKDKYCEQLFLFLRQQAYYAGLDPIMACKLFKEMADNEKLKILEKMGYADEDTDNHVSCSTSKLSDIFEALSNLKDACEKSEENEKESDLN